MLTDTTLNFNNVLNFEMNKLLMLMHDLEVLCNEPWCCILCWQFDMQFSYATHLAHPVLCRPPTLTFLATLVVSCAFIYDDAIRACAVCTVTAVRTGKFVLLTYSLTASHCSTEAHLAGVPFPRSFDSRLALRQS